MENCQMLSSQPPSGFESVGGAFIFPVAVPAAALAHTWSRCNWEGKELEFAQTDDLDLGKLSSWSADFAVEITDEASGLVYRVTRDRMLHALQIISIRDFALFARLVSEDAATCEDVETWLGYAVLGEAY